jgi:hypothetical protein
LDVGGNNAFVFNDQDLFILFRMEHGNRPSVECLEQPESLSRFTSLLWAQVRINCGPELQHNKQALWIDRYAVV